MTINMMVFAAVVATILLAASADGAATRWRSDAVYRSSGRPGDRAAAAADGDEEYDPFLGIRRLEGSPGGGTMSSMPASVSLSMSVSMSMSFSMSMPSAAPSVDATFESTDGIDPDKAWYCQEEMDMGCYKDGWPQCCSASAGPCPPASGPRPPGCDTVEVSIFNYACLQALLY